jgi:hypothetical protein
MSTEQEFVGCAEIEEMFGLPKHRVIRFMKRGLFAKPIAPLKAGYVFRTREAKTAIDKLRRGGHI